jgi:hypothetical protein
VSDHRRDDGVSKHHRNVSKLLPNYTAQQRRRRLCLLTAVRTLNLRGKICQLPDAASKLKWKPNAEYNSASVTPWLFLG